MTKFDNIPHLYRVMNTETGEAWQLFAKNNHDAICKIQGEPDSDQFWSPLHAERILTIEGYRITTIRHLKKGTYFNLLCAKGNKPTHKRTYVRGEYNRSYNKYECSYFDDFCHTRLLSGDTLVTIDVTF